MTSIETCQTAFLAALEAADPTKIVKAKIRSGALDDWFGSREHPQPIHVVALGKAAPRMVWGLIEANVPFAGIGVTTKGQRRPSLESFWHEGGQPVPDGDSFASGQAVFEHVDRLPTGANVLVLISGGASACVDVGDNPAAIIAAAGGWLRSGQETAGINAERAAMSCFKAGGLGRRILERTPNVRAWVLNDLAPGQERLVGSGPCDVPSIPHTALADASFAARATADMLTALGSPAQVAPRIAGPLDAALDAFFATDLTPGTAVVAAGEPTFAVPEDAPLGGRCQHAAMAAAERLGDGELFFAGATDGRDGTTREAAAWSFGGDADAAWQQALANFDGHGHLSRLGQTLRIGSTGTNLNDVWIRTSNP